jgi:ATP synthase protein I
MTPWKDLGRYGTVGIELILSMAIGYYGGRAIDARVGGHGWVTFLGFVGGVAVGFRSIFATARYMPKDIERAERRDLDLDPWQDEPPNRDGASRRGQDRDDDKRTER